MLLRMSSLFLRTLREDPADAEVPSHRLLVRAGYVRRVAPGIFTWLPLGFLTFRNVERIVREEMDSAGFQEVHVPALAPPAMDDGEALKKIDDLPEWARPAFKGMATLNRVQSRVCDAALFGTSNLLLCAPTGAGKTNVAMLTILQQVGLHRRPDGSVDGSAFKCVYIAPMKALVAEQTANLAKRLAPYGLTVRELTGDSNLTRAELDAASAVAEPLKT